MGNGDVAVVVCDSTPEGDWGTINIPIPPGLKEKIEEFTSLLRAEEMIIEVVGEDISFLKIEGSKSALDNFREFASLLKRTDF